MQPSIPKGGIETRKYDGSVIIWDIYSARIKTYSRFVCACIAFLTPFTDTIYLPALSNIKSEFNCSTALVADTVSVYVALVGFSNSYYMTQTQCYNYFNIIITVSLY